MTRERDSDVKKGAEETEAPGQQSQANLNNQIPLRTKSPLLQDVENDFPEPGQRPEHSGQAEQKKTA